MQPYCKICDRVPFGRIVHLGFDKWRHEQCSAGSTEWRDYYQALSTKERTAVLIDVFNCYQPGKDNLDGFKPTHCDRSTSKASIQRKASAPVLGQRKRGRPTGSKNKTKKPKHHLRRASQKSYHADY